MAFRSLTLTGASLLLAFTGPARAMDIEAIMTDRCFLSVDLEEPVDESADKAALTGSAVAGVLVQLAVKAGVNAAIDKFVESAKPQVTSAHTSFLTHLFEPKRVNDSWYLERNPNLGCMVIAGVNRGKVNVKEGSQIGRLSWSQNGRKRSERLKEAGFVFTERPFPDFLAEIEFKESQDGTAAYAILRHLDIEDWPTQNAKRRRDPHAVALNISIAEPDGPKASFSFDLGTFQIQNADGNPADNEMKWIGRSAGFQNSFPGFSGTAPASQTALAQTSWVAMPGLTKSRLELVKYHAAQGSLTGKTFGPATVTASLHVTLEAEEWRQKLAAFLQSDAGKAAAGDLTSAFSKALLPPTLEEIKAKELTDWESQTAALKAEWDFAAAKAAAPGLDDDAKGPLLAQAHAAQLAYLFTVKCGPGKNADTEKETCTAN